VTLSARARFRGLLRLVLGSAALLLGAGEARALGDAAIPSECGSLAEFEGTLRDRLGSAVALDATHLALTRELSGYRLNVAVGDERRELYDADCRELLRAAVVIALALLEPPRKDAPLTVPPSALAEPKPAPTPRSVRLDLGAEAGVHLGTVPQASLLLGVDAGLSSGRWGAAAGLRYLAAASIQDARQHGARVSGGGASLAGSFRPWPPLEARLGFILYRLFGTGLGTLAPRDDAAWEAGPTLGVSYRFSEKPPFFLRLGAEGQLNLLRARFEIRDYGRVFATPWVSGSGFVRAGVVW